MAAVASGLADELSTGAAQLYLAAGLRRTEYLGAWLLLLLVYPLVAIVAGILIPILIVEPTLVSQPIAIVGTRATSLAYLIANYGLATVYNAVLVFTIAVATRSGGKTFTATMLLTIAIPFTVSIIGAAASISYDVQAFVIAFFNPFITALMALSDPSITTTMIVLPAVVSLTVLTLTCLHLISRMEV